MKNQTPSQKFPTNTTLYSLLTLCILVSWAFILWHHNHQRQQIDSLVAQLETSKKVKRELIKNYDASLVTLDSLSGRVSADEKSLIDRDKTMSGLQEQIDRLLRSETVSLQDNQKAERLIQQLNGQIAKVYRQIRELRAANALLTEQRNVLVKEKEEYRKIKEELETEVTNLASRAAIASTLTTDSICIVALKKSGRGTDRVTKNMNKADKFLLSFNVYNRIIDAGATNVCISIIDPSGQLVKINEDDAGRNEFTVVLPVNVEPGVERNVQFQWLKAKKVKNGSYKILVYHNGYIIGEATVSLGKLKQATA